MISIGSRWLVAKSTHGHYDGPDPLSATNSSSSGNDLIGWRHCRHAAMEYTGAQYEPKTAYESGRFEGQGTFTYANGTKYVGEYITHFLRNSGRDSYFTLFHFLQLSPMKYFLVHIH